LLPQLLDEEETRVHLLIRARSQQHLQQRVEQLLSYLELDAESVQDRLSASAGDVSQPGLGLDAKAHDRLTGELTHIIHAAGNVKLSQTMEEARHNALEPARQMVLFAQACRDGGKLRKLEFVTTVGVAGSTPGLVEERRFTEPRKFRNTYEAAKAETEEFLFQKIPDLPITIHRPSMVVGDSRSGKIIHYQVFYYLAELLVGLHTRGVVPRFGGVRLDIVPADYVARVLQLSAGREDAAGKILHLCSGPGRARLLDELALDLRAIFQDHGERLPRLRRVSPRTIRRLLPLLQRVVAEQNRRALRMLPFFLDYVNDEQVFDNSATEAFFASAGLKVPQVDAYLDTIVAPFLDWRKNHAATAR